MNSIREALEQTGINTSTLDRIRLSRGVVGKASWVVGAAILVTGGIAFSIPDTNFRFALALGVLGLAVIYLVGMLFFANRHPGVALLEGAELIQWRRLDMIAKSGEPIESIPVPYKAGAEDIEAK